jgi:Zn-finger nucleic acid-binding protein
MTAGHLRCPGCGAPAGADLTRCAHCSSALAAVACPACFGRVFRGTPHCPHCGASAARVEEEGGDPLACPDCRSALAAARVGATLLHECGGCHGIWVGSGDLDAVVADGERQAALLAFPGARGPSAGGNDRVRYRACPACGTLMHRMNFARISGVVLDVCREHGSWFDPDELRRVVEFVRGGGLERARVREREALEEARRSLERARQGGPPGRPLAESADVAAGPGGLELLSAIASFLRSAAARGRGS